eukprot:2190209-Karenia_brevis.AAC.1
MTQLHQSVLLHIEKDEDCPGSLDELCVGTAASVLQKDPYLNNHFRTRCRLRQKASLHCQEYVLT